VEFLLAIGAVVALLWAAVVLVRGGLIGGALLVLLAGSCFGHPFFNLPAGPLPFTADRVLLAVLLMQYAMYRRWGWTDPKPLVSADYALAALVTVLLASTFSHDFLYRKAQPLAQLVFFFLMPTALYWVVRQSPWTRRGARWVLTSLALFGAYLCLTAVAETHGAWAFVVPRYIASPEVHEFFGRGRGPFLNPVANGMVQSLGLCAALMAWPHLSRPLKLLLVAALPLFAWGIYSTLTRSVWMGTGLGLLIVIGLSTPRDWRLAVLGTAVMISAVTVADSWQQFVAFKRDRDVSVEDVAESAKLRPILAAIAWHMFLDRPIFGCGYGQYIQESPAYLADRTADLPLEKARPYVQHNVFLALVTETGLVGMGLFVALLASWTSIAWRLWRCQSAALWVRQMGLMFLAFVGIYLPNAMFHDVSIIPMVNMLLFFLGAAVTALTPWLVAAPAGQTSSVREVECELAMAEG